MYIDSVEIRYLKLLEDFKLSFVDDDGSVRKWTVIIGKNGTAKTSILQAIALAAAGRLQVNKLASHVVAHLRDRRKTSAIMRVRADFRFEGAAADVGSHPMLRRALATTERLRSAVHLRPGSATLGAGSFYVDESGERVEVELSRRDFSDPLDDARAQKKRTGWFMAGYGVSRFLPDPSQLARLEQPSIERMQPLFQHTAGLTSLRFIDWLEPQKGKLFAKVLRDTLTKVHELVPDLENIELRGQGGVKSAGQLIDNDRFQLRLGTKKHKLPAVALSHGYQSVIAWIADLIGHMMYECEVGIGAEDMRGVVLLDEIDLYLHPVWQGGLVFALRQTFPNIQFIATTHSPVILASLRPNEIVRVGQDPDSGSVRQWGHDAESGKLVPLESPDQPTHEPDPQTMTATELYRSWFGVDRLLLNPYGAQLREWRRIAGDPFRSDEEDAQLSGLRGQLEQAGLELEPEPVEREEL